MKLIDLNLLLYVINEDAPQHARARKWWERTLAGHEQIGLPWSVLIGFLRLSTRAGVLPRPLSVTEATAVIDEWLAHPLTMTVEPSAGHWGVLKDLLNEVGAAGNLTTDAHLAGLVLEYDATLCSSDRDFVRFRGLKFFNPLDAG